MILLRQKAFSKTEQKEFTKKRILAKKGKQIYNKLKSIKGFESLEQAGNSYTYGFDIEKLKKVNAIESVKKSVKIRPDKLKALNEYENQLNDKLEKDLRHSWGGRNRKGSGKAYRRKLVAQEEAIMKANPEKSMFELGIGTNEFKKLK